jgi:hypothetical protein
VIFKLGIVWKLLIFQAFFLEISGIPLSISWFSCQFYIEINLRTSPLIVATNNVVLDLVSEQENGKFQIKIQLLKIHKD